MRDVVFCSPFPPAQNGIADYSYEVVSGIRKYYSVGVCSDRDDVQLPGGVSYVDVRQAADVSPEAIFVHQIGNNADHAFVVEMARRRPGILVLHDLRLLWLYLHCGLDRGEIAEKISASSSGAGRLRAKAFLAHRGFKPYDFMLFDLLDELVEGAHAIVVHSEYARRHLLSRFGDLAGRKTTVIPHFAFSSPDESRKQARLRLGIDPRAIVVATFGFATRAKCYDLIAEALSIVLETRRDVVWVQAGPVRPEEYDLNEVLKRWPEVQRSTRITGYLSERDLAAYIAAADIGINLRFPSVGESSGSLARLMSAGLPCIVTRTAAYREFPDETVLKFPPQAGAADLANVVKSLAASPGRLASMAQACRRFAASELAIEGYVEAFRKVIDQTAAAPSLRTDERSVMGPPAHEIGPLRVSEIGFGMLQGLGLDHAWEDIEIEVAAHVDNGEFVTLRIPGASS